MDYAKLIRETLAQAEEIERDGLTDLKPKHVAEDLRVLARAIESLIK